MAATKTQGTNLAIFWISITVLCAGLAYLAEGFGKLVLIVGAAGIVLSLVGFLREKPLEGKPATPPGNMAMKGVGTLVTWLGWFVTVVGLHLTTSTGGRLVFALAGIAVSLVGILGILPTAFGRSAAGKITAPSFMAAKTTMEHTR